MDEDSTVDFIMEKPWKTLKIAIEQGDTDRIKSIFGELHTTDTSLVISRLNEQEQKILMMLLEPAEAAEIIEDVHETQASDIIERLPAEHAATIVDEIPSDLQADLLGEMDNETANGILDEMPESEAQETRAMISYPSETAGGIMISEFLSYPQSVSVNRIREDLKENREVYADYPVKYVYVIDGQGKLSGRRSRP